MASVKCNTCGAVVSDTLANCDTCGNPMASGFGGQAPQSGFGGQAQSGFGGQPQSGFGNAAPAPAPQSGFGTAPTPQGGFGTAPAPQGGFGTAPTPQGGFGQPAQSEGFGQGASFGGPPQAESSGFGAAETFQAPPSYDAKPAQGLQSMGTDEARFAETLSGQGTMDASIQWNFKQSLLFCLKCFIPVYGLILIIMCLIGNPKKYPVSVTNYLRASIVVSILVLILSIVLTMVLGLSAANAVLGM